MPIIRDGLSASSTTSTDNPNDIYTPSPEKWFETQPYGFAFFNRDITEANPNPGTSGAQVFYLPISPQNIQITTNFATNIISTLYGVTEEHSAVKFYDIVIAGTTGIAPQFIDRIAVDTAFDYRSSGRSVFQNNSVDLGGFLPEVTNVINQALNFAEDANETLNGGKNETTGIEPAKTGYAAFHNFYRFLLQYKKDAAGIGKAGNKERVANTSLQFLNYKDGNRYDCAIRDFTLTRNTENPFLYNYNIKMRCYNLRSVSTSGITNTNQAEKLGLTLGNSVFSQAAGLASSASAIVSGFI